MQWAAVISHCSFIIEAPHKVEPSVKKACHGHELGTASTPPTILISESSGLITGTPHSKKNKCSIK